MIIIDRFEGETAVLETDEGMINVYISELPENSNEGDVLVNSDGTWSKDTETTEMRKNNMRDRMKRLINNE